MMSIYGIKEFLQHAVAATDDNDITFTRNWVENFIKGIDYYIEEVKVDKDDLYDRIKSLKSDKDCLEEQLKVLEDEKEELLSSREKLKAEMSELNRENLNLKAQLNEKQNEDIKTSPTMTVSEILHLLYNLTVCRNDNDLGTISIGRLKNIRSSIERYYDVMEDRVRELKKEPSDYTLQRFNDLKMLNENQSKTIADLRREVERLSDPKNGFVEFVRKVIKEEEDSFNNRIRTRLKDEIDKVFNERVPDMRVDNK